MSEYILEMTDVSKEFPGVKALDHARLYVRPGTVQALVGENGAGKSTLMKCLFGLYSMDEGKILLDGKPVVFANAHEALTRGVGMVQQELNQVHTRNVMENIWLGRFPTNKLGMVSNDLMYKKTLAIFKELNINIDPLAIVSTLSVAQRQMLEIAKAFSHNPKVLAFDEPTSSLTLADVNHLFKIIRTLKARGCGIIYISHRLEEIFEIADTVTIMRDGKWIATKPIADTSTNEVIKLMVGRELTNVYPPRTNVPGSIILQVRDLSATYQNIKNINFDLARGEILGIAGLAGSGRTQILESIFGIDALDSGKLVLNGKQIVNKNPNQAIKNGFALVTEERRATGIFGILNIKENTTISSLDKYRKGFFISDKGMGKDTQKSIDAFSIKTPSQKTKIRSLSGGNQQKVIFGRWLLTEPEILMLDEPTRGIDVGAKYEIYQIMINLANQGKGIIMVSSELPELLGVCNRILVMSEGHLSGEVAVHDKMTANEKKVLQEEIMTLASKCVYVSRKD